MVNTRKSPGSFSVKPTQGQLIKCSCGASLMVQPEMGGKKARCSKCGKIMVLPAQAQLMKLFHDKLQQKIVVLARKVEEEQATARQLLETKNNEIQVLKDELAKKETGWAIEKRKIDEKLSLLKTSTDQTKTDWEQRESEYREEITKLKNQLVQHEDSAREIQADKDKLNQNWEEEIGQLEDKQQQELSTLQKQLTDKEKELNKLKSELEKTRQEWNAKLTHLEKDHQAEVVELESVQTQMIEEELEDMEKKLEEERKVWRDKLAREKK